MFTLFVEIILMLTMLYLVAGFVFAIAFVLKGARVIDEGAKGGSIGFSIIIFPGSVVFWPVLLQKWRRQTKPQKPAS